MGRALVGLIVLVVVGAIAVPRLGCAPGKEPSPDEASEIAWRRDAVDLKFSPPKIEGKRILVGDPQNPDTLGREIQEAYANGAKVIEVRSGTYRLHTSGRSVVEMQRWRDVRIEGHGATLISGEIQWGNEIFHLEGCMNVQIDNFVLSQNWQTALQGKVLSVSQTRHTECVWRPDPGYPVPSPSAVRFNKGPNIVDPRTRKLKLGCRDEWDASIVPQGNGTWRVLFPHSVPLLETGDILVSRGAAGPSKIHLIRSHNCVIQNVTLDRNAFAAILENEGGGNHILDCTWDTGPKLDGETDEPLVSSSVDGFHSNGADPGPDLERCNFKGVLLDDCIAIHGDMQSVVASSGSMFTVDKDGGHLSEGMPIRVGGHGFVFDAKVVSIHRSSDHTVDVQIDRPMSVPVGACVSNPLWNGAGFKVIGCQVGNTRSRGMLVKGDQGVITDNVIENCGMSGVCAGPDYPLEADFVEGLTVKRNRFVGNGFVGQSLAACQLHGGYAMGNRDVDIQDNQFLGNFSGDIDIRWTKGVSIGQNEFSGPSLLPSTLERPRPIRIGDSASVKVAGSQFKNTEIDQKPFVLVGPEVTDSVVR